MLLFVPATVVVLYPWSWPGLGFESLPLLLRSQIEVLTRIHLLRAE